MTAAVAIPAEYRDDLAPVLLTFTLATDDDALDLTEVVSVRAIVERSDRETLEWAFDIETSDPAPTATEIVVSHTAEISDFFDSELRAVAPATYTVRFLARFPAGERPLGLAWLPVERFL